MKLPDKMNPAHCASTDHTRYILNGVAIRGDLAAATDGRTLCVVKGTRETDDHERDALIPTRVAKAAWPQRKKARGSMLPMLMINEPGPQISPGVKPELTTTVLDKELDKHTAKDIDGNFPRFEMVLPDDPVGKNTLRIGINVKLLLNLSKAMGSDGLILHLNPEKFSTGCYDEGMLVSPVDGDKTEAFGVIMPIRASNLTALDKNRPLKDVIAMKAAREAEQAARHDSSNQPATPPTNDAP